LKKVVWKNVLALLDGVINDNAQSGSTSKRIDATQASRAGEKRWGSCH
jgi:hypothetical protein